MVLLVPRGRLRQNGNRFAWSTSLSSARRILKLFRLEYFEREQREEESKKNLKGEIGRAIDED